MTRNEIIAGLKIGDIVRWTSQSGGHSKTKEGEVVYLGKTHYHFSQLPAEVQEKIQGANPMSDYYATHGILVLVRRKGKRGQDIIPYVYSPNPKHLEVVRKAEAKD